VWTTYRSSIFKVGGYIITTQLECINLILVTFILQKKNTNLNNLHINYLTHLEFRFYVYLS